jgi:hypothetical protein
MANLLKGVNGIVSIYDGVAYRPVACLTSNSLASTLSVIESNTKCDPGVVIKNAGTFSYSLSMDGEYIDTTSVGGDTAKASHDYLLTKQRAKETITWKLDSGLLTTIYYGTAIVTDLDLTQGAGDEISTFSATFDGSGDISTVALP